MTRMGHRLILMRLRIRAALHARRRKKARTEERREMRVTLQMVKMGMDGYCYRRADGRTYGIKPNGEWREATWDARHMDLLAYLLGDGAESAYSDDSEVWGEPLGDGRVRMTDEANGTVYLNGDCLAAMREVYGE